jgi:hypothetical protein
VVVILTGAGRMVRLRLAVAETPAESFTVAVTVKGPGDVGVPLRVPSAEAVSPPGNPVTDHEYGGVPPDALNAAE